MRSKRPRLSDPRLYWREDRNSRFIWCRLAGGARESTRCTVERAAVEYANRREREIANPRYAAAEEVTLGDLVRAIKAELKRRGRSAGTLERARFKLGHYVRLWGESMPIAAIDRALHDAYLTTRLEEMGPFATPVDEASARVTLRDEMAFLRQGLKLQIALGHFPRTIEEIFPIPWETGAKPRQRAIALDQAWTLIDAVKLRKIGAGSPDRRVREVFAPSARLAWHFGTFCRRSEAESAERSDVNATRFPRQTTNERGETIELPPMTIYIRGTKTDAAEDVIPITKITLPFVKYALAHAPNQTGKGPLFDQWGKIDRDMKNACERVGLPRLSTNDLRRSAGKWHSAAGVPHSLISKLFRHTTDKLSQTTYARTAAPAIGEQIAALLDPADRRDWAGEIVVIETPCGACDGTRRDCPSCAGVGSVEVTGRVLGLASALAASREHAEYTDGVSIRIGTGRNLELSALPAHSKMIVSSEKSVPPARVERATSALGKPAQDDASEPNQADSEPPSTGGVSIRPAEIAPDGPRSNKTGVPAGSPIEKPQSADRLAKALRDPVSAAAFADVKPDHCRGAHPPEWDEAGERWVCERGCGPLDARARGVAS